MKVIWLWNVADWEESRGFRLQNPIFSSFQISRTLCPKAVRKLLILAYIRTEILGYLFLTSSNHLLENTLFPFLFHILSSFRKFCRRSLSRVGPQSMQGWPLVSFYKHMFTSFLNKNTTLFKRIIFYKYLFVGLHTYELGDIPTRFSCLWPRTQTDAFALNILYLWPSDWYY